MPEMPWVDPDKCNGCGICVSICRCRALVLVGGAIQVIAKAECGWCTHCEAVCPTNAIRCPYEIVLEG